MAGTLAAPLCVLLSETQSTSSSNYDTLNDLKIKKKLVYMLYISYFLDRLVLKFTN